MEIFLAVIFLLVCIFLILMVLLQKGRGEGLGAALGGGGGSAFGTRTGDLFTWVTIVLTGLFLLLAIGANFAYRPSPGRVSRPEFRPGGSQGTHVVTDKMNRVRVFCATKGASIHWEIGGGQPTEDSPTVGQGERVYVPAGATLKARAFREHWKDSVISSVRYLYQADTPEIHPDGGEIEGPTEVRITCPTEEARITYTTGGEKPTDESSEYTGPFTIEEGVTVRARAFGENYAPSETAVARFEMKRPAATQPAP